MVFQKLQIFGSTFFGILIFGFVIHVAVVYGRWLLRLRKFAVRRRRNPIEVPSRQESGLSPVGFRYDVANDSMSAVAPQPLAPATSVVFVTGVVTSTSA